MELMNWIRERVVAWQKKRVRTVVFPLAGKLCAVETVEGKRLGQWQADYDGDTSNLKECFLSLKAAGLRAKKRSCMHCRAWISGLGRWERMRRGLPSPVYFL